MTHREPHHDEPSRAATASAQLPSPRRSAYVLTRDAVREIDLAAIEDYRIPGIVLMENAARGLADAARDLLSRARSTATAGEPLHTVIVCGSGNNGGDGYALARHLHNDGMRITLITISEPKPGSNSATNCDICRRMNLREISADDRKTLAAERIDLIVDAIFGTGLDREVAGLPREMIEWINEQHALVLAVDVPSGLDCDTDKPLGACVKATMTVTFVALKPAFQSLDAQRWLGEVRVADIGAPRELIEQRGTALPPPPPDR